MTSPGLTPRLLLACALLAAHSASSTEDTRPQIQNSPTIATPDAVKTNPFSGTATYAYRFELPSGTGRLTPELVLRNNTATRNTEYGYGWSLSLSRIERSTRFGAPDYLAPDVAVGFDPASGNEARGHRFELDGELLVRDPLDASRFHRRAADGSRVVFHDEAGSGGNGYWEVTQLDGSRYRYGSRPAANSEIGRGPVGSGSETFRWALDEVIDPRGNAYRIDYELDTHDIGGTTYALYTYPRELLYSYHHSGTSVDDSRAIRRVTFEWQGRGDPGFAYDPANLDAPSADRPTSYRPGFKLQQRKRLAELRVDLTSGAPIRSYTFEYAPKIVHGDDGSGGYDFHGDVFRPNSELVAIQRHGMYGGTFPSRTTFDYASSDNDFEPPVGVPGTGGAIRVTHSMYSVGDTPLGKGFYDFDGDGFLDRTPLQRGGGGAASYVGFGLRPSSFSGDYNSQWAAGSQSLFRNAFDWNSPPEGLDFGLAADMIDLDGDGRVDRVEHRDCNGSPVSYEYCWLRNNGSGFDPPAEWPGIVNPTSLGWTSRTLFVGDEEYLTSQAIMDLNGDGLPDHTVETWVYLNNGAGFDAPVNWPGLSVAKIHGSTRSLPTESHVDMNGDGLPDRHALVVCLEGGSTFFNLGDRFQHVGGVGPEAYEGSCTTPVSAIPASPETGLFGGTYSSLIDLNGDGVLDLVTANQWGAPIPFDASGPHWNVYYGLGDGRFLYDAGGLIAEESPVDGTSGINGAIGHHWSIPGFRIPELVELGQGGSPAPAGTASGYWLRYTDSAGTPGAQWNGSVSDLVDLTGDGIPDYLDQGDGGNWLLWENSSRPPLLTRVSNEAGGSTAIEYLPAPHAAKNATMVSALVYPGSPGPESHSSGAVVERAIAGHWLVQRVEVRDGRDDNFAIDHSETLAYREPRFDRELRETLGHRMVARSDAVNAATRSLFHQTRELRGRLQATERLGLLGNLLDSRETLWSPLAALATTASGPTTTSVGGAWFAEATQETLRTYEPADSSRYVERIITRTHDPATGLLLIHTEAGRGATHTRTFDYAENWSDWLIQYPSSISSVLGSGGSTTDGPRSEFGYDGLGLGAPPSAGLVTVRRTLHDGDHTGQYRSERWSYDPYGNQLAFFDGNAVDSGATVPTRTTVWESDWQTFPETIQNALGETTRFLFHKRHGEVFQLTEPAGLLRCFDFDEFGRLEALARRSEPVSGPPYCDQEISTFLYGATGDPEKQFVLESRFYHPNRKALWNIRLFDGLGRTYKELRHAGGSHETGDVDYFIRLHGWDQRGHRSCESLPVRGPITAPTLDCWSTLPRRVTTFDPLGRPVVSDRVTAAGTTRLERVARAVEDLDGDSFEELVATVTTHAEIDRVTQIGLDGWNQIVVSVADPNGDAHRIDVERDGLRRVTGLHEYAGSTPVSHTDVAYYQTGERKSFKPPGAAPAWTFRYDDSGNRVEQISRALGVTRYEYDAANRLILRDAEPHETSSTCCLESGDAAYRYASGRLVGEETRALDHSIEYTLSGEIAYEAWTYGEGLDLTFSAAYLYDWLGRPTLSIVPGDVWPARHYDGTLLARIEHFKDGIGDIAHSLEYHASGMLASIVYPVFGSESLTGSYGFDPDTLRLTSARVESSSGAILQDRNYTYDDAANLTGVDDGPLGQLSETFAYDAQFRLTSTIVSGALSSLYSPTPSGLGRDFRYSPAGLLTNKGDWTLEYGSSPDPDAGPHTVTTVRDAAQNPVGSYVYDANGAVTSISRDAGTSPITLDRDGAGRVVASCPDVSCSPSEFEDTRYRYGANGARVRRFQGNSVDHLSPARWFDVDLVGNTHTLHYFADGQRIASVQRSGLGAAGSGGGTFDSSRYYHPDLVGSNALVTDSNGAVLEQAVMAPFGERLGTPQGGQGENSYAFSDQPHDDETGLDYFGARYYDPWIGRFLSPDPAFVGAIEGEMFERASYSPVSLDPYAYVTNRPTVMRDENGDVPHVVAGAAIGGASAIGIEIARQLHNGATLQTLDTDKLIEQGFKGVLFGAGGGLLGGVLSRGTLSLSDVGLHSFGSFLTGVQIQSVIEATTTFFEIGQDDDGTTITSFHRDPPVDDRPVELPCSDDCRPPEPRPAVPEPLEEETRAPSPGSLIDSDARALGSN